MAIGTAFPDVLCAARAGAAWAFEALYRELAPAVTGYLRMHGALEPDDLASETFIGLFTGLSSFEGDEGALRAWVFTIAHRRLVDDWRRRSRRPQLAAIPDDGPEPAIGGDVEDDALAALGSRAVHELCAALPDDQRSVILMRIVGDLSLEQVAAAMGRSVASVKALQRRGLLTLRSELQHTRAPSGVAPAMSRTR